MNPNEIKKALEEHISQLSQNKRVALCGTKELLEIFKSNLAYINQLEAEVERLNTENRILSQKRFNLFERLEFTNKIRAKAIKEFAERLKATFPNNSRWVKPREKIDSILKEMVGDEE